MNARACAQEAGSNVVTDHGHHDEGGHSGRSGLKTTACIACAGPGTQPTRVTTDAFLADCRARLAFDLLSNTWNAVVLWALREGPRRPVELRVAS